MKRTSKRIRFDTDIRPISEFRANAAELIDNLRGTGRPLVLTQRGHAAAVVLDVQEYERLAEEIELLREVREAEQQIESGQGVAHGNAKQELRRRLRP